MLHVAWSHAQECKVGYDHVIMFQPISVAARRWSYGNAACCLVLILDNVL